MVDKLERVPPAWSKLHTQSQRALLVAEGAALGAMRRAVKAVHGQVLSDLASARSHIAAISAVQRARGTIATAVAGAVYNAHVGARDAALGRVQRELAQVGREASALDLEAPDPSAARNDRERHPAEAAALLLFRLRSGEPAHTTPPRSDAAQDRVLSASLGQTYAAAWAAGMLGAILRWERTAQNERPELTKDTAPIVEQTDYRLRRIAATETARAFNDEHAEAVRAVVLPPVASPADEAIARETARVGWMAGLVNRWDATLDRRTCKVCRDHDGEIVPVGMRFRAGDRPGDVHVMCRCIETLLFLPGRIGQA